MNTSIYAIDKETGERCWVNAKAPKEVSNDQLEGEIMLLMRDGLHKYFEGKQRRFDLQFQFRFKETPKDLWYGAELDESLNLGTLQRLTANAVFGFCQKMNPGSFHSRVSSDPCMVFKVANSMDRVNCTKAGDIPPCLGEAIEESPESIRRRERKGMEFNTNDTYTISCFSAYFDFLTWAISLPGLPSVDVTKIVGNQPFRYVMYTLKDENGPHTPENKNYFFNLEISNPAKTKVGPAAREWIENHETKREANPALSPVPSPKGGRLLMKGRLSIGCSTCFPELPLV